MASLLVVGDGPVSDALLPQAQLLGWAPVLVTTYDEVVAAIGKADAVVVTSHREDVDAPALKLALERQPVYIGGMGSRRTQARRQAWLAANGVTDLDRIHGPAGLDIGADTPAEIALAILAELVATVRGRSDVGSIKDRDGPIHPELGPGEAFCPAG